MDTHDLPHMLAGDGADWSTVDMTDEEQADFIASLADQERAEFGLPPRGRPAYQPQARDLYHPGRRDHLSDFHRVRWFASRGYRQAAQFAELDGDAMEASRLHMEASAMAMMEEGDLLIADLQNLVF
ncbi:hypothetical protein SAMN05518849_11694 [Sphingobium sp. AP50]|uniref:hypothetical protein n=1 Tax=Sphingobium sp. AP50 TaxID=1884369 RepID=UPI0008C2BBE0|nr:hypothetical protein [Sphingobium sp. AP50]SEJ87697.1 hypothetical protein SAMN05518849_11694 [Sphingobium sp. AP50]